jgi:hypothetical protein
MLEGPFKLEWSHAQPDDPRLPVVRVELPMDLGPDFRLLPEALCRSQGQFTVVYE